MHPPSLLYYPCQFIVQIPFFSRIIGINVQDFRISYYSYTSCIKPRSFIAVRENRKEKELRRNIDTTRMGYQNEARPVSSGVAHSFLPTVLTIETTMMTMITAMATPMMMRIYYMLATLIDGDGEE